VVTTATLVVLVSYLGIHYTGTLDRLPLFMPVAWILTDWSSEV